MNPDIIYMVKTHEGREIGPLSLDQVELLVQEGRLSSTSMILKSDTQKWHLAISLPEIRALLRKHSSRGESRISRLWRAANFEVRNSDQFSIESATSNTPGQPLKKRGLFYKIFYLLRRK